MDFRYDNGTGPMDARSPFAQVGASQMNINQYRNNQTPNDKKRESRHAAFVAVKEGRLQKIRG